MSSKKTWTAVQIQAFSDLKNNLVISAGAGSGKTSVLVERFLNLIQGGLHPSQILAVTFTDKAASEMKQRLFDRFQSMELQVSTMHSFCSRILKENALAAGVDPAFRLLDQVQMQMLQEEILDNLFEEISLDETHFKFFEEYEPEALRDTILKIYGQLRGRGDDVSKLNLEIRFDLDQTRTKLQTLAQQYQALAEKKLTPGQAELLQIMQDVLKTFQQIDSYQIHEIEAYLDLLRSKSTKGAMNVVKNEFRDAWEEYYLVLLEREQAPAKKIFQELISNFHERYQNHKKEQGFLDYEDLLLKTHEVLNSTSAIARALRAKLNKQFKAVMIDEMQDTNPLQFEIFKSLEAGGNLFYVGDLKQSIYRFRNADLSLFQNLIQSSKSQDTYQFLSMDTNFRSTPAILNFVNAFFGKWWQEQKDFFESLKSNPQIEMAGAKPVWALVESPEKTSINELRKKEAAWVAGQIEDLIANKKINPGDVAILLRSTYQAAFYENALKSKGLSYQVLRAKGFFDQPEVQDLFSFLKILNDPGDDLNKMAVLRSPLFGVSDQTLLELRQNQSSSSVSDQTQLQVFEDLYSKFSKNHSHLGLASILRELVATTGYDAVQLGKHAGLQRFNNIQNFIVAVEKYEKIESPNLKQLVHYLEKLKSHERFESDGTPDPADANHIQILTIHSAKGLEFPVVFVCDLEHEGNHRNQDLFCYDPKQGLGLKPLYTYAQISEAEKQADLEEHKRVLYVAFTRAKQYLFLSTAHPKTVEWLSENFSDLTEIDFVRPDVQTLQILKTRETYQLQKIYDEQKTAIVLETLLEIPKPHLCPLHLSATQYALLPYCPRAFGLSRRLKNQGHYFKSFEMEEIAAEVHHDVSNAFLGKLVHQAVSKLSAQSTLQEWQQMILDRQEILKEASDQKLLMQCIQNYQTSPYAQIASQKETLREQNFMLQMGRHQLRGILDLAFKEKGEWVVVDYKTSTIESDEHRRWLRNYYFGQLQAYAYALEKITGEKVKEARLVFLSDLKEEKWDRSELFLEKLSGDFLESGFQSNLEWKKENCRRCHFKEFCIAS